MYLYSIDKDSDSGNYQGVDEREQGVERIGNTFAPRFARSSAISAVFFPGQVLVSCLTFKRRRCLSGEDAIVYKFQV